MKKFEIVMLGNTSVGKTSMLAVLSREVQKANSASEVTFVPCEGTTADLDDAWNELSCQIEAGGLYRPVQAMLGGTTQYISYHFNLQVRGSTRAKVDFVDTKGSFILDVDNSELLEQTQKAFGVFCVVDAAVMMACDTRTNDLYNRPGLVKDLLGKVFSSEGERPKFVAFVLTKCETWMQTEDDRNRMVERFHEIYGETVDLLRLKKVNCYAMAVETIGCVKIKSLVEVAYPDESLKLPQFVKTGVGRKLKSRGCSRPLAVAMKNLIREMHERRGVLEKIFDCIGLGDNLLRYVEQIEGLGNASDGGVAYYEELGSDRT